MTDLSIGNMQAEYCYVFDGSCPYLGAFVILPGFKGREDAVCVGCIYMISAYKINNAYQAQKAAECRGDAANEG
jgi:hypothetical protein